MIAGGLFVVPETTVGHGWQVMARSGCDDGGEWRIRKAACRPRKLAQNLGRAVRALRTILGNSAVGIVAQTLVYLASNEATGFQRKSKNDKTLSLSSGGRSRTIEPNLESDRTGETLRPLSGRARGSGRPGGTPRHHATDRRLRCKPHSRFRPVVCSGRKVVYIKTWWSGRIGNWLQPGGGERTKSRPGFADPAHG